MEIADSFQTAKSPRDREKCELDPEKRSPIFGKELENKIIKSKRDDIGESSVAAPPVARVSLCPFRGRMQNNFAAIFLQ